MDIKLKTNNSDTIFGILFESGTKESIVFASVEVYQKGNIEPLTLDTKLTGKFKFPKQPQAERIVVKYLGFRTFDVNLVTLEKKLTAHNNH